MKIKIIFTLKLIRFKLYMDIFILFKNKLLLLYWLTLMVQTGYTNGNPLSNYTDFTI